MARKRRKLHITGYHIAYVMLVHAIGMFLTLNDVRELSLAGYVLFFLSVVIILFIAWDGWHISTPLKRK